MVVHCWNDDGEYVSFDIREDTDGVYISCGDVRLRCNVDMNGELIVQDIADGKDRSTWMLMKDLLKLGCE